MKDGCDFVSLNKVLVPFWLLIPFLNCCWWQWLVSGLYLFVHYPFSPDRQLLYFFSPCPSLSLPLSDTTLLFSSSPVPPAPRDHERQSGPCIEDFRITGRRFSGAPGSPWSRFSSPHCPQRRYLESEKLNHFQPSPKQQVFNSSSVAFLNLWFPSFRIKHRGEMLYGGKLQYKSKYIFFSHVRQRMSSCVCV